MFQRVLCLMLVLSLILPAACLADYNKTKSGVAIKGYDPVAYFTDHKAVKGRWFHRYRWMDAVWYFVSDAHKKMFITDPEEYAPQYGGFGAYGMSLGEKTDIDPQAFMIVDGKLYLNFNRTVWAFWNENRQMYIRRADEIWNKFSK